MSSNKSGILRTEATPHGILMNSSARKTFSLEHSRQNSQEDIMNKSAPVQPIVQSKLDPGSPHPQVNKTLPKNPYLILLSEIKSLERKIQNATARDFLLKFIVRKGMTSKSRLVCQGI